MSASGVPGVRDPAAVVPRRVRPPSSHRSTLKPDDVAAEPGCPPRSSSGCLRRLASNPHRFHEDRSEIAHDIAELARIIAPRRVRRSRRGRGKRRAHCWRAEPGYEGAASADYDQRAQAASLFITDMLAALIGRGNGVTTVATPFQ
jgi:hypothetical protein